MKESSRSRGAGREPRAGSRDAKESNKNEPMPQTPSTDLQGEDAGTAASGSAGPGTPSEGAMKQTSKTGQERGSGG